MIFFAAADLERAVDLLDEEQPHHLVRECEPGKGEAAVGGGGGFSGGSWGGGTTSGGGASGGW